MAGSPYPKTPMLNKMLRVQKRSQAIGEFLEWYRAHDHDFETIQQTLARYFKIDLAKVEQERLAILDHIRKPKT
jgi:hypothetical protein